MAVSTYVTVLKPFKGADREYQSGDVVDAGGWRLLQPLLSQRRIRMATTEEIAALTGGEKRRSKHGMGENQQA